MGTHQGAVSQKHLDYYMDEFTFRFNRRRSKSRGKLFFRLAQQAVAMDRPLRTHRSPDPSEGEAQFTTCWAYLSQADTHFGPISLGGCGSTEVYIWILNLSDHLRTAQACGPTFLPEPPALVANYTRRQ